MSDLFVYKILAVFGLWIIIGLLLQKYNKINYRKGWVFILRPHLWLPPINLSNILNLTQWISQHGVKYDLTRDYSRRYALYEAVLNQISGPFSYLEFGVYQGASMKWWAAYTKYLYGFDTFEGLPEKWGKFAKGDMKAGFPNIPNAVFYKGLFQKSLPVFLKNYEVGRKVVHMDADLFSSTLFVLSRLPFNEGDILIFDEFNCPNDEFAAYKIFTDCFDVKTELICQVNNYHQVAFKIL